LKEGIEKAKISFDKIPSITVREIEVDRRKLWRVKFPDYAIGSVDYTEYDQDHRLVVRRVAAKNTQDFPVTFLTYSFSSKSNPEVFANPGILDKIDPKLFSAVGMDCSTNVQAFLNPDHVETSDEVSAPVLRLLSAGSKWTRAEFLSLKEVEFTEEMMALLEKWRHLRTLYLDRCTLDLQMLARQKFLLNLRTLKVSDGDLSKVLEAISKSREIYKIELGLRADVTADAVKSLAKTRSLKALLFDQPSVESDVFDAAIDLKQLQYIAFDKGNLTRERRSAMFRLGWIQAPLNRHIATENKNSVTFERRN